MDVDISVIVPTRGTRPALLHEALVSIAAQTRAPSEVLVVVDGPEDRARLLMGSLVQSPVPCRVASTGAPGLKGYGVSAARNLGARIASSRWLAFLDDDDRWMPEHLRRWSECANACDVWLSAFLKQRRCGTIEPEKWPPACLHPRAFFGLNPGLRGSNLVVRAAFYARVGGFDEDLPALNDLDFGVRLAELPGVRYLRHVQPTVIFRSHDGPRLTTRTSQAMASGVARFWSRYGHRMNRIERERFQHLARVLWNVCLEAAA